MQLLLSLRLILMSKIMDVKTQKPTTERILVLAPTDDPLDLENVNTTVSNPTTFGSISQVQY
jgi:hypothetical protein